MAEDVFLTASPLYMHFRQTRPEEVTEDTESEPDFLLRDFGGQRYTSHLAETVLNNSVRLQKDLSHAMRVKLTKLKRRSGESDATETELLENDFNAEKLIEDFNLYLGRVDEQTVEAEVDRWRDAAIEHSIEPVIEHLEEYLTGQSDIPDQPANRLRLRTVPAEPSSVMNRLKSELGNSNGAIVATGVKWYDNRAEGLDMAEEYPIVSTRTAPEYRQRNDVVTSIRDEKSNRSYTLPQIIRVTKIET